MTTQEDNILSKLAESMSESLATDLSKMDLSKDEDIAEIENCLEVKTEKDSAGKDKDSPRLVAITSKDNTELATLHEAGCRVMLASNKSDVAKLRAIMKLQANEYKKINPIILVYEDIKEENEFDTKTELEKIFTYLNLNISFKSTSCSMLKENGNDSLLEGTKSIKKEILEGALEKQEIRRMQSFVSLEDTLNVLADKSLYNATETGFKRFDEMLGGGVRDGRLYALGAISSLGKTTFALNIADNVAKAGRDVLIFSLEMSRVEWQIKSLSRQTYQRCVDENIAANVGAVSSMKLLTGRKELTEQQTDTLDNAIREYAKASKRIYIKEGIGDVGHNQIRDTIANFMQVNTNSRPLVIIDYLQLMSSPDPKSRLLDKQIVDKNVLELKRMTRDFNLPIIVISSFNRDNYTTSASFQAFKESGAIEYSADVVIALELNVNRDKDKKDTEEAINEAKNKNPRDVKLVILKNRFYKAWTTTSFEYYPEFDYFKEAEQENNECPF
jgi:replicative DNA helicase